MLILMWTGTVPAYGRAIRRALCTLRFKFSGLTALVSILLYSRGTKSHFNVNFVLPCKLPRRTMTLCCENFGQGCLLVRCYTYLEAERSRRACARSGNVLDVYNSSNKTLPWTKLDQTRSLNCASSRFVVSLSVCDRSLTGAYNSLTLCFLSASESYSYVHHTFK